MTSAGLLVRRLPCFDILVTGWRHYLTMLDRYPARTHAINTCVLMGAGDVIAQLVLEGRRAALRTPDTAGSRQARSPAAAALPFDFGRTARFCVVGLAMAGPSMHVWYRALDRVVRGSGLSAALRKTAADQVLFLPVYLVTFVGVMAALRGERSSDIVRLVRRDMGPMLAASYAVWPVVQLANFRFVPLRHRILVINVVCLFWNTYIGWRAERQTNHQE